jgi:hypothetical protein
MGVNILVGCVLPMAITSAKDVNYSSVATIATLSDSIAILQYKESYGVTIHINEIPPG